MRTPFISVKLFQKNKGTKDYCSNKVEWITFGLLASLQTGKYILSNIHSKEKNLQVRTNKSKMTETLGICVRKTICAPMSQELEIQI